MLAVAMAELTSLPVAPTAHLTGSRNCTSMPPARSNERSGAAQVHWRHGAGCFIVSDGFLSVPTAQLPKVGPAPAAHVAAEQERTREVAACGELNGGAVEVDRCVHRRGCFIVTHVDAVPRERC
jgi:hypothetical protein